MCQRVAIFVLFDISTNIWHVHASEEIFYFLKFKYYILKVHFSNKTKNVHNLFFDTSLRSWRALNEGLFTSTKLYITHFYFLSSAHFILVLIFLKFIRFHSSKGDSDVFS